MDVHGKVNHLFFPLPFRLCTPKTSMIQLHVVGSMEPQKRETTRIGQHFQSQFKGNSARSSDQRYRMWWYEVVAWQECGRSHRKTGRTFLKLLEWLSMSQWTLQGVRSQENGASSKRIEKLSYELWSNNIRASRRKITVAVQRWRDTTTKDGG